MVYAFLPIVRKHPQILLSFALVYPGGFEGLQRPSRINRQFHQSGISLQVHVAWRSERARRRCADRVCP